MKINYAANWFFCQFWEGEITEGRGYYIICDEDAGSAGFEASVMGQNTAVAFIVGRHAIWLEKQGRQASHEYAVNQVAEVFGNDIRKRVLRSISTAWTTDPWTRGSYSCALPGHGHQRVNWPDPSLIVCSSPVKPRQWVIKPTVTRRLPVRHSRCTGNSQRDQALLRLPVNRNYGDNY
jgi:hypothetical protein